MHSPSKSMTGRASVAKTRCTTPRSGLVLLEVEEEIGCGRDDEAENAYDVRGDAIRKRRKRKPGANLPTREAACFLCSVVIIILVRADYGMAPRMFYGVIW